MIADPRPWSLRTGTGEVYQRQVEQARAAAARRRALTPNMRAMLARLADGPVRGRGYGGELSSVAALHARGLCKVAKGFDWKAVITHAGRLVLGAT
jgi:hypothetical protein